MSNQISYLKTITSILKLCVENDFKKKEDDFKISIGKALTEINGFLLRFNNDCIGGINKSATDKKMTALKLFTPLHADVGEADVKRLEEIKSLITKVSAPSKDKMIDLEKQLQALEKEESDLKLNVKDFTRKGMLDQTLTQENIDIVNKNINDLQEALSENNMPKDTFENMLNLIQKTCLSACGFNNIRKAIANIENIGGARANELLPALNQQMLALNEAARKTQMFDDQLLGELDGIKNLKQRYPKGSRIGDFLGKYAEEKIGFRGRAGEEPKSQELNKECQIANKQGEEGIERSNLPNCSVYQQQMHSKRVWSRIEPQTFIR